MKRIAMLMTAAFLLAAAAPVAAQGAATQPQVLSAQSLTISAEIVALDASTRKVKLRGPLGGLIEGVVSDEVKDLSRVKVGDLVSVSYYEAIAASVHRKGDAAPLFSASDVAARAEPGKSTRGVAAASMTVTVVSVDRKANSMVLQGADGTLYPTNVVRPEFQAKLKDVKPGDQIDVTYSEALITGLTPLAAGEEAKMTMKAGTLVIDAGEVVKRNQNVLIIRNSNGRMVKAVVDGDFRFNVDGKEMTVYDLREGTKLVRTAIRVREVSYSN